MSDAERPLSVVQVLPALEGGGVERGTVEVANALVSAGHRSSVISAGGGLVALMHGTEHFALPLGAKSPLTFRYVRVVREFLRRTRPDVLHLRSRMPAWIAYFAWRGLPADERPSLVTTVHGRYSVSPYSSVMARGEYVIAVSNSIEQYVRTHYSRYVDPARVRVIYRGVDGSRYFPGFEPDGQWLSTWKRERPHLSGRRILTLPGRITRLKGHLDFLRLLAGLRDRGLVVHGLIVGGEDTGRKRYATTVRRAIVKAGLSDQVEFLGHRSDLREIMAVSDLTLSLSAKPESFGRTVLEALSLGRPVIGYAHGGVAEILDAMYARGWVAPGDLGGAIAAAERALMTLGPISSAPQFELRNMLDATLALYREAVTSRTYQA